MEAQRGGPPDAPRRRQHEPHRRPSGNGNRTYAGTVLQPLRQPREPRPAPPANSNVRPDADVRAGGSSTRESHDQSSPPDRPQAQTTNASAPRRDDGERRDTRAADNQDADNEPQDGTRPRRDGVNHRRNGDGSDQHRRDDDGGRSPADVQELKFLLNKRRRYIQVLKDREAEQDKELEKLKSQLARAQTDRDQVDELMKDRTAELHSAQTFLGKADGISIAEVSKSVEFLNAEIHQAAAIIMDSVTSTKLNKDDKEDIARLNASLNALRSFTGSSIHRMLLKKMTDEKEDFDPTVSQIVLQSGLVSACAQLIKQWDPNPPSWDSFTNLDSVYGAMRISEGQAIAGRWRALAHAYIISQCEDSVRLKGSTEYLKKILGCLLAGVGWSSRTLNVPIPPEYEEKIDIIARKALDVHIILKKEVTSMDLEAYVVSFDEKFDPESMDDEYGDGKKDASKLDQGVCTVALGLRFRKIIMPKNHGNFKEEIGDILKPKVVLVSALVETDE